MDDAYCISKAIIITANGPGNIIIHWRNEQNTSKGRIVQDVKYNIKVK